jgi:hypothetical protein
MSRSPTGYPFRAQGGRIELMKREFLLQRSGSTDMLLLLSSSSSSYFISEKNLVVYTDSVDVTSAGH